MRGLLVNNKLENMWTKSVEAEIKVLSRHVAGGTEKKRETAVGIAGIRTRI
jgi:hypothetical protein